MNQSLIYRLSLGLAFLLALAALVTLLGWLGALINGAGKLPFYELLPWNTVGMIALAAINCTLRARLIVRRSRTDV